MRVRILQDRRFVPPGQRRITVHYKAGQEVTVRRIWGETLVATGFAVEIEPPSRPSRKDD